MFPAYSEVVKVVFTQVISNHVAERLDIPLKVKMHAEFVSAINTLCPNAVRVALEIDHMFAKAEVELDVMGNETITFYAVADFNKQVVEINVI